MRQQILRAGTWCHAALISSAHNSGDRLGGLFLVDAARRVGDGSPRWARPLLSLWWRYLRAFDIICLLKSCLLHRLARLLEGPFGPEQWGRSRVGRGRGRRGSARARGFRDRRRRNQGHTEQDQDRWNLHGHIQSVAEHRRLYSYPGRTAIQRCGQSSSIVREVGNRFVIVMMRESRSMRRFNGFVQSPLWC